MALSSWEPAGQEGSGTALMAPIAPALPVGTRERVPDFCPPFEPPFDDAGDGGGGGDDGAGDGGSNEEDPSRDIAEFGLGLALVGIGTIFAIFLLAWFLLRQSVPQSPRALSAAPPALWAATACLLGSSVFLQNAIDRSAKLVGRNGRVSLVWSLLLGLGFLASQSWLWTRLWEQGFLPTTGGYGSVFYALTGLHAAHVLAGWAMLFLLLVRALRPGGLSVRRLKLGALYWHSMGGIWVVLFLTLYLGR